MTLTLKSPHAMMCPNWRRNQQVSNGLFYCPKLNTDIFHAAFLHGISGAIGLVSLRWFRRLPLVPGEKAVFLLPKKGDETMLQQANGHVLPQNYQIDKEQIFLGQKNFTIMGQVRVIFFEDANGDLQAMIKFDQHSPELLKREGLVFALAEMVENEGLLVTV